MSDKKSISECLNIDDFKVLRHQLILKNEASQTQILNPKELEILEFSATNVIVKMKENLCQEGHFLTLFFYKYPIKKKIARFPESKKAAKDAIEAMGKVAKKMKLNIEGMCAVNIQLTQFDEDEWNSFCQAYRKHQDKINRLSKVSRS